MTTLALPALLKLYPFLKGSGLLFGIFYPVIAVALLVFGFFIFH
jgi:hypothetical protein